jgi:hypothetical protein
LRTLPAFGAPFLEEVVMDHVHAGTCDECNRDMYTLIFPNGEARSPGTIVLYHLGERCAITPSYDDLHEPT